MPRQPSRAEDSVMEMAGADVLLDPAFTGRKPAAVVDYVLVPMRAAAPRAVVEALVEQDVRVPVGATIAQLALRAEERRCLPVHLPQRAWVGRWRPGCRAPPRKPLRRRPPRGPVEVVHHDPVPEPGTAAPAAAPYPPRHPRGRPGPRRRSRRRPRSGSWPRPPRRSAEPVHHRPSSSPFPPGGRIPDNHDAPVPGRRSFTSPVSLASPVPGPGPVPGRPNHDDGALPWSEPPRCSIVVAGGPAARRRDAIRCLTGTTRPATPVLTPEEPHLCHVGAALRSGLPVAGPVMPAVPPVRLIPAPAPRRRCRTGSVCHWARSWVPRVPPSADGGGRRRRTW